MDSPAEPVHGVVQRYIQQFFSDHGQYSSYSLSGTEEFRVIFHVLQYPGYEGFIVDWCRPEGSAKLVEKEFKDEFYKTLWMLLCWLINTINSLIWWWLILTFEKKNMLGCYWTGVLWWWWRWWSSSYDGTMIYCIFIFSYIISIPQRANYLK